MKNNVYCNAVEHLQFSGRLEELRFEKPAVKFRGVRFARISAVAAMLLVTFATTAFAVSPQLREWTVSLLNLGTSGNGLEDAREMRFTLSEVMEGVRVRSLQLDQAGYRFIHGMLYSEEKGFFRITEDYRLQSVDTQNYLGFIRKNDRKYYVDLDYAETDQGIVAPSKNILQKNESGELYLNATDGNSNQWPVYIDLDTGAIRDALPAWNDSDFDGRVVYAEPLKGGILVTTLVNDAVVENGNSVSFNRLYWIAEGAEQVRELALPEDMYCWYCEYGELYYKNNQGYLFGMNDDFSFTQITDCKTGDDLTNGLLTAATDEGKLVIQDVLSSERYVIDEIQVDPGLYDPESGGRINGDLDETMGYNATRYSAEGRIALVQTALISDQGRVALKQVSILDKDAAVLKILQIENRYDGFQNGWLDENRYAVIFDNQYLCVYEFA